ncbi:MAG: DUF937 domain-containing protein [Microbacteriaceae bacterium]
MADLSSLKKQIPVDDIAARLGVDRAVADDALDQVLPGLVSGLAANASDGAGRTSLEKALSKHSGRAPRRVDDVDTTDGDKIVSNVFGGSRGAVASKLADNSSQGGVTQDLIQKLLPIVAPFVLAWLANQFLGKKDDSNASKSTSSGGGIGDLLGGLLGGGGAGSSSKSEGGDLLGGLLGGLIGGGKR